MTERNPMPSNCSIGPPVKSSTALLNQVQAARALVIQMRTGAALATSRKRSSLSDRGPFAPDCSAPAPKLEGESVRPMPDQPSGCTAPERNAASGGQFLECVAGKVN